MVSFVYLGKGDDKCPGMAPGDFANRSKDP